MPFKSRAQERWAHTAAGMKALGGASAVKEWESETPHDLPEKVGGTKKMKHHSMAGKALAHAAKPPEIKHLKEMHIRELHDGTYHVARHDGKGGIHEMHGTDVDHLHDHIEEHFGGPNADEEMAEGE